MTSRRILCLWFPRLGAERVLRRTARGGHHAAAVAVVREVSNMQLLHSLSAEAENAGLRRGQPLRDALAMQPDLVTHPYHEAAETAFLVNLQRWAGKFSPWVGICGSEGLSIDISGCAHLFGGEDGMLAQIEEDCARFQLTLQAGIADTLGAAWALARYATHRPTSQRSGDAIDQEAPATRARAVKRRNWERGGAAPQVVTLGGSERRIAAPGQTRMAIAPLPTAALRLPEDTVSELHRLGLRRIQDLIDQPRAPLARRFGVELTRRLDQAIGDIAEPVSPAKPPLHFAARMTLPDPIGREEDVLGIVARLLPVLTRKMADKGRGARCVRLEAYKTDQSMQMIEVRLARISVNPDRILPLIEMQLGTIKADFGIDMIRLSVPGHEKRADEQTGAALTRNQARVNQNGIDDLIGRLGNRIGLDQITRLHPASSHAPEKAAQTLSAAWSEPCEDWEKHHCPRPLILFEPEIVTAPETPQMPHSFRWRGQRHETHWARGPERIAPEWWLEERHWRTGTRDYWEVVTRKGARLWLYFAHGGAASAGWFCQGEFS